MKKNLLSAVLLTSAMAGTALTSCTDTEVPGGGNNSGTKGGKNFKRKKNNR